MKFIVFWTLCNWVPEPCTEKNTFDKFGREYEVLCRKEHGQFSDCKVLQKEFTELDSAVSFYNEALKESDDFNNQSILTDWGSLSLDWEPHTKSMKKYIIRDVKIKSYEILK